MNDFGRKKLELTAMYQVSGHACRAPSGLGLSVIIDLGVTPGYCMPPPCSWEEVHDDLFFLSAQRAAGKMINHGYQVTVMIGILKHQRCEIYQPGAPPQETESEKIIALKGRYRLTSQSLTLNSISSSFLTIANIFVQIEIWGTGRVRRPGTIIDLIDSATRFKSHDIIVRIKNSENILILCKLSYGNFGKFFAPSNIMITF